MFEIDDIVWIETTDYSASRARITGYHNDGYYVSFIDKTNNQKDHESFPVLKRVVKPIDYIGNDK